MIFLDDLQWVDSASLKLIQLLMTDDNQGYLFLIGAYRDNEVSPAHPLMRSEEHTSELQSRETISYAVFCLKKKKTKKKKKKIHNIHH